ncbi:hypothetical protein K438DRAFT_1812210 [Mycena galopus ATCC 62051]|nr:hypothetical protein K438DRAFT_1812210 [Mycena galopus ATCC 62051]
MSATPLSVRAVLIEQIEQTRHSSKADIERLIGESELKITALESQISSLVDLRNRESAYFSSLKYILSPICTLPVELLTEIFKLTIHEDTDLEDAFRVSQVCSDWRQLAHNTPRLWTGPTYIDLPCESHEWEQVYAWMARSVLLPIPVSFILQPDVPWDTYIPEEVMETAPRWCSLELDTREDLDRTPLWMISRMAGHRLDGLEELHLGCIIPDIRSSLPSFTTVPRLRKLSIGIYPDALPELPSMYSNALPNLIPWAQLTHLSLNCDLADITFDILALCANLVHASVTSPGWESLLEARPDISLGHLRTFSLSFFGYSEHLMPFFDLSAPALEELCVGPCNRTLVASSLHGIPAPRTKHYSAHNGTLGSHIGRPASSHSPCTVPYPPDIKVLHF